MKEQNKPMPVDYDSVKLDIFVKVSDQGPMQDIESWKKAYPEVDFMEVDEFFSGEKIKWENRTAAERAFFVAYMKSPQDTEVNYDVTVEGTTVNAIIDDSEKIWWMWLERCFTGEDLDEEALRTFLWYADDSTLARKFLYDIDLSEVSLDRLKVRVSPL